MVFRRRFQSGTLGRSIRRFGRFPTAGLKRKQFATYYGTLLHSAVGLGGAMKEVTIIDESDWGPNSGSITGMVNVRNVSVDHCFIINMIRDTGATLQEDWVLQWMIIKTDVDQAYTNIADAMAQDVAIRWGAFGNVTSTMPTGTTGNEARPSFNWRVKYSVPFIKEDQELRFLLQVLPGASGTLDEMNLSVVSRIRYEIP